MDIEFLKNYLAIPSPSGFELKGQRFWLDYLRPYSDEQMLDPYLNAACILKSKRENPFKIVIESHADEISWIVKSIDKYGSISVMSNGGVHPHTAVTKRIWVHTRKGKVPGFFCNAGGEDKKLSEDSLTVDLGVTSRDDARKMGVEIGDPITYQDEFFQMGDYFVGRGLDNRIGAFIMAEVFKKLKGKDLAYDLYVVNSSQEEVGKRGAELVCKNIKPDMALVLDVGFADAGYYCGGGPVVVTSPAIQKLLLRRISNITKEHKIPYQLRAKGKNTMTNADIYSMNNVITGLIQLPLENMHTTVEKVHKNDVAITIELLTKTLLSIDSLSPFSYRMEQPVLN